MASQQDVPGLLRPAADVPEFRRQDAQGCTDRHKSRGGELEEPDGERAFLRSNLYILFPYFQQFDTHEESFYLVSCARGMIAPRGCTIPAQRKPALRKR